jgi:hypothetical protein
MLTASGISPAREVGMPLVFVHGVANRWGESYARGRDTRDAFFRRFLLRSLGSRGSIRNPYWGDLGGRLRWNGASMPLEDFESLGAEDATLLSLQAAADPDGAVTQPAAALLTVARRSLPEAVDLLWAAAALGPAVPAEALAELGAAAYDYAEAHPRPAWLDDVRDDAQFLEALRHEVESAGAAGAPAPGQAAGAPDAVEYESLGVADGWNAVTRAASALRGAAVSLVGRSLSDRVRPAAIPSVANFLGDVFVYLHQQEAVARPIAELVEGAFREAADERSDGDPFVVVAHSLGGIVSYDLLTSTAADLRVDLLITVGTQVGFFEELKLFTTSDAAIPADGRAKVPRPAAVRRWINVFDHSDLLGYAVGPVIDGVSDFAYRTGSLLKAHSAYFVQPGFHRRLAARAVEPGP